MTAATEVSLEGAPLAVAQEGMWYRSILAPTLLTYNETISIRKDGPLDAAALRQAFDEIVRRHEAWRSTFEVVDGQPTQVVHRAPKFDLPATDLRHLAPEEAERHAVRLVAEVSRLPYDLLRGPLVRPRLFHFPGDHHRLYLAMHHLVFDGVTLTRVVLPQLVALYGAFEAGEPSPFAEPSVTYADYARWQQRWIAEPRTKRRVSYWSERLADAPALDLPLDRPRPSEPRLGGGSVPLALAREELDRLRAIGLGAGATLFQVLATCWSLLLHRQAGQPEVVFATAADMRQRPEHQGLVGCCLTPLVLRVDLSDAVAVRELVVRLRNELLDGLDQLVPFERVVRELPPSEDPGANPVYQAMLVLEPATAVSDSAWSVHQIDSRLANAVGSLKLDLELQLDERPDGELVGQLIYDRDLFDLVTAERLADQWLGICTAVANAPDASLADIPTVPASDRRRQLVEWNATSVQRPAGTVHELIEARALAQPESVALSEGGRDVSFGEADRQAGMVAARLSEAGVRPGDVVAVLYEPSIDLVLGALGALKAGAAHLLLDPGSAPAELRRKIESAGAAVTLAKSAAGDRLGDQAGRIICLDRPGHVGPAPAPAVRTPPDSDCFVRCAGIPDDDGALATSHAAAANLALALAAGLDFSPADTCLTLGKSLFRAPEIELWLPLIAGARIVLPPAEMAWEGSRVSRLISTEKVSFLHASPSAWQALIDTGLVASRSLRVLSGGGRLAAPLAQQILDRCRVLWNAYGSVQPGYCTLARVERSMPVTIGRPIANTRAYVLDGFGQPAEIGVTGELIIAADRRLSRFLGGSGRSARPPIDDPFAPGIAYQSGDRARWLPGGELELP